MAECRNRRAAFEAEIPSFFLIAQALQWAAFGIAGGVAAGRGGSSRPAVSMSIALAGVSFVRTLYLVLQPREREAFAFLLFDLLIAVGWGVGLIACPTATAALRRPQASSDAATAGGPTSNART